MPDTTLVIGFCCNGDEQLMALEEKIRNKFSLNKEDIANLVFTSFMKSAIIEPVGKVKRQLAVAKAIENKSEREMATAFIYGVSSKLSLKLLNACSKQVLVLT